MKVRTGAVAFAAVVLVAVIVVATSTIVGPRAGGPPSGFNGAGVDWAKLKPEDFPIGRASQPLASIESMGCDLKERPRSG